MSNGGAQAWTDEFHSATGVAWAGYTLTAYTTGGPSTPKDIWSDEAKTSLISNSEVTLDAQGRVEFYGDGDYYLEVTDLTSSVVWSMDNVKITSDTNGMWEGNHGSAYPSVSGFGAEQQGMVFYKIISNALRGVGIMANASVPAFDEFLTFDANGNPLFDDIVGKWPIADIRHTDFGGGATTASADNSTAIQAAIAYLDSKSGGVLFIPPGTYKAKNLDLVDNIQVVGVGRSSILSLPATIGSGEYLLKATNLQNIDLASVRLDGNSLGNSSKLLWVSNTSGTNVHVSVNNCYFENHAATGTAIQIEGASGFEVSHININDGCHFRSLGEGVVVDYADSFDIVGNFMDTIAGAPVLVSNSTNVRVAINTIKNYGATEAGIQFTNTSDSHIEGNNIPGSSTDSIVTDGTSNYNNIIGNNVRGGHTNDITSGGANDMVHSNQGSSLVKNGQGASSGTAGTDDWDYVKFSGTATDATPVVGKLEDTAISFPDTALAQYDPPSGFDHILAPTVSTFGNSFFVVRNIDSDNVLTLGASDQFESPLSIPNGTAYELYPNLTKSSLPWETNPFWEQAVEATGPAEVEITKDIYSEEGLFRLEIWGNAGNGTLNEVKITYGDTGPYAVIATNINTILTTKLLTHYLKRKLRMNTLTVQIDSDTADMTKTSKIIVKLYRLKRPIDI